MTRHIPSTGQTFCADDSGKPVPCEGTGQDAETRPGLAWNTDRFKPDRETVLDTLTGLTWLRDANAPGFPISRQEAFAFVDAMNTENRAGHNDWRLPNRRELFSLITFDRHSPALPDNHPFNNVFQGWYWTSTGSAMHEDQAWHVHFMGGRMFWGSKDGYELVWPVRGASDVLPAVTAGPADHSVPWPEPRFEARGETVIDKLTGLTWTRSADLGHGPTSWTDAFAVAKRLNAESFASVTDWRLPTIRELESLADSAHHSPALPDGHPFTGTREAYWSSTNSAYEPDWAMCFYLHKGAVGVGFKQDHGFHVWAVSPTGPRP
jgi:hypothetical protein